MFAVSHLPANSRFVRYRNPFLFGTLALLAILFALQLVSWAHPAESPEINHVEAAVENSSAIPGGTILPVQLDGAFSVKVAQKGQAIETKLAQEVVLPNGDKIPARTSVKGSVVSVTRDGEGPGVTVTLKFTNLEGRKESTPISTFLRAIASYRAVYNSHLPISGSADAGTPSGWSTTYQIGGDIRYGDGGAVRSHAKQKVGKGVRGGVMVHVKANPARGCEGPTNRDDYLQALWVFSADACGVYDLND
ncbi:MAG TPA: hypothetical protein VMH89_11700, partial [Candidatus Acidoferrum sp.]|nr:hypothetical protein [Candidatus Acidoferrum sp.]